MLIFGKCRLAAQDFFYAFLIRVVKSRMNWMRHVSCMGWMKSAYRILVGRPEGKSLVERHRHRE